MIIKDLIGIVVDKVIIYKEGNEDYVDLYEGNATEIPQTILDMKVIDIGRKINGILDIQVE